MLEHMILYLQYTISFLIELVQERIPNKLQSPGPQETAVGIHIPNRSIILGLWRNFTDFLTLPFSPGSRLPHSITDPPVSFGPRSPGHTPAMPEPEEEFPSTCDTASSGSRLA